MSANATFQNIISSNNFSTHRKPLIQSLEKELNSKVIVYTASLTHPLAMIMSQDIPPFEDLLRSAGKADEGYLMINSAGGDGNVAEKLIMMCRQRFSKSFKVIVPNFAKSAATMIALGSDKILMGYLAELGPIDPQLGNPIGGGLIPARSFIDGLEMIRHNIKDKGDPVQMYYPMLSQIRPEIIAQCQSAIDGSREFAEKWLKTYMLKDKPEQAQEVACALSEGVKYKSHGKVIDYSEALNELKLKVEMIPQNSKLWDLVWQLYCRSIVFLQQGGAAKLFESEAVSLTMGIELKLVKGPQEPRPVAPAPIRAPPPSPPQPPQPSPPGEQR